MRGGKNKGPELTPNHKHIHDIHDAWMLHGFENLDFPKSSDRHALFLIVHENAFESHGSPSRYLNRFVDFTG